MRYLLSGLLVLNLVPTILAQGNEAEKLFRAMEKKIIQAKAFKVVVAIETGRDTKRPGSFKGFLLLTKDNKARLKFSGVDFGEVRRWEMVSDGKQIKLRPYDLGVPELCKEEATLAMPKRLQRYFATCLIRWGVYPNLPRMAAAVVAGDKDNQAPKRFPLGGFKMSAAEKIGDRDAKVIRYKIRGWSGIKDDDATFTVWIDTKTLLPLKRVSQLGRTFGEVTEIYKEFILDPHIGAGTFELTVGQASEAEKRVRAQEEKLNAAQAVQVAVRLEFRAKGKRAKGHASLLFTKGNQARLKVKLDEFGKKLTAEMVSDGKQVKFAETPDTIAKVEADPAPAALSRRLARMLSGPGLWLTYHDLSGSAPVWDFHLVSFERGAAMKVGGRNAKVISYMVAGLPGTDWNVTLWIDAKTGLPFKRVITPIGGEPGSVTETYEITLHPKITAGAFQLAK